MTRIDLSAPYAAGFTSGRTMNISVAGVGVRILETVPEVGTRLDFGLRVDPVDPPVRGCLEIVWVRPFHAPDGAHEFGARVLAWNAGDHTRVGGP